MGVLNVATPSAVRSFSQLPEVKNMDDIPLGGYIDRAEFILSRRYDYVNTDPSYAAMMKLAVQLLTENLVLKGLPTYRRSMLIDIVSERIGTYSYTRGTTSDAIKMYPDGTDDEILAIARAFAVNGDVQFSMTHVFPRRTFIVNDGRVTGVRWYYPEDVELGITEQQDPPLPQP